ncbi:hypothetical protein ACCC97_27010 [Variovorax sp. Varisp85]|uniref:hypothetical protein n=1 Tax=Variovorax sp. Varisp85 TaxID=3243059 RepID=UPI0039A60EAF
MTLMISQHAQCDLLVKSLVDLILRLGQHAGLDFSPLAGNRPLHGIDRETPRRSRRDTGRRPDRRLIHQGLKRPRYIRPLAVE